MYEYARMHLWHLPTTSFSPTSLITSLQFYKHKTRIIINLPLILMADDAALRASLVCLAAIMLIVGFYTYSFKKMMATYLFGMFAVAGIVLPDWEFFDRPVSQWTSPLSVPHMLPHSPPSPSRSFFLLRRSLLFVYLSSLINFWL
ncbi:putative signal peptidase complex subunit Spc1/SPCS1 [Helianthus annuus]|nr:putative signal peptidase complex subunit Spc1/SPCS1 [Helianthus annuus]